MESAPSTVKPSVREERIKKILSLYYSRPEIQKAMFEFSENREVSPSFMMESFGKRPDTFQYPGDIFGFVKKGATSFHCSQELWSDPMKISTEMNKKQFDELRIGWDLILDIDSKYIDYSKIMVEQIVKIFRFHGLKNFGIKFSGSKGFHIIVPWKAFPKEVNEVKTSDMFPEWPRIITKYLLEKVKSELTKKILNLTNESNTEKYGSVKKYVRREGGSDQIVKGVGENKKRLGNFIVDSIDTGTISQKFQNIEGKDESWNKEVVPDLILVSSRHLFRMPYSLHEKTALASVVVEPEEVSKFQLADADPFKAKVKNFMPDAEEGEASELLREALDWYKMNEGNIGKTSKEFNFKPIKLSKLSDKNFPPSIIKILEGLSDGRKRALFILIGLFRSIGMEKDEMEKRIDDWNKKNEVSLKEGYIKSQLSWSYRNKVVPPPNFAKDYYKGIGINPTEEELRYKNPANYVVRKTLQEEENQKRPRKKNKDNFKNKK